MKDKLDKLFSDIKDIMLEARASLDMKGHTAVSERHAPERIVILMLRAMMEIPELWDYMSRRVLKYDPIWSLELKSIPFSCLTLNTKTINEMMDDMRKIEEENGEIIKRKKVRGILRHDDTRP